MWLLPAVSQLVPSSVPAPGIHSMVGLGAPPAMEDPIPCPWSRNRLPLIGGREGLRAGSIQLLELLSPWKQRAGPLCEHRKGSSFSEGIRGTSLSGLPASWPGWGWGGSQGDRLASPLSNRPCHLALSHPSWSLPKRAWFRRAAAHPGGEGKGIRGKGQFSDRSESGCYPNPSRGHS